MKQKPQLALHIKQLRNQKGLTQEQVAEHTGISLRTIQRIEAGKVQPQLNTLCQLSQLFEIKIEELTAFQQNPDLPENKKEDVVSKSDLALLHLSPLAFFIFPMGNIAGPVFMWLAKKKESSVLNRQAIQLINFQISLALYFMLVCVSSTFLFFGGTAETALEAGGTEAEGNLFFTLIFGAVILTGAAFFGPMLWNVIKAPKNKAAFYPLAIPFLREKTGDESISANVYPQAS